MRLFVCENSAFFALEKFFLNFFQNQKLFGFLIGNTYRKTKKQPRKWEMEDRMEQIISFVDRMVGRAVTLLMIIMAVFAFAMLKG